jgi:hypothetical protein
MGKDTVKNGKVGRKYRNCSRVGEKYYFPKGRDMALALGYKKPRHGAVGTDVNPPYCTRTYVHISYF